jgi:hypothetical protein
MLVFISSTYRDLKRERLAVQQALSQGEAQPWGMEFFNSSPDKPLSVCLENLRACSAVVLVIGARAGSLIADSDGLTYTGAEIKEARRLGLPVFPFILRCNGKTANDEPDGLLSDALERFRDQIQELTPAYFENLDELKFKVLVALKHWSEKGRPGSRKTFASFEEFFAEYQTVLARQRLFDFEQTLVGREEQIAELKTFVLGSHAVEIIVGRGGIGKTKLLHEFVKHLSDAKVMFLRRGAIWHRESENELPTGSLVVIADDAHRDTDLSRLIECMQTIRLRERTVKLIISCRPRGLNEVNSVLSRRYDPSEIVRMKTLDSLARADIRRIAVEELGNSNDPQLLEWLVDVSADAPLVTIVGARLIKHDKIHPSDIKSSEAFERLIFDRFIDELHTSSQPFPMRGLLELVAALAPDSFSSDSLTTEMADHLRCEKYEVCQALGALEESGLLVQSWQGLRIAPDVLADRVLERACVSPLGSTGYADAVVKRFGRHKRYGEILANLGEVDWRVIQKSGGKVTILDGVWVALVKQFRHANAADRCEILEMIKRSAIYKPDRALEICQLAMDTEAAQGGYPWTRKHADVLNEVGEIFKVIALHFEYVRESVTRLLDLWRKGVRGADRQLTNLAEIRPGVGVAARISELLAVVEPAIYDMSLYGPETSILDLIDQILKPEVDWQRTNEEEILLTAYPLNYPVVKPVRDWCFRILENCLCSSQPRIAMRALRSLLNVIGPHLAKFGRVVPAQEAEWQDDERMLAMEILSRRALREDTELALKQQIFAGMRKQHRLSLSKSVDVKRTELMAKMPRSEEFTSFDAFVTPDWDWDRTESFRGDRFERYNLWLNESVERFIYRHPTPAEQILRLEELTKILERSSIENEAMFAFVSMLAQKQSAFISEFMRYVSNAPHPRLGFEVRAVLGLLRDSQFEAYVNAGLSLAFHPLPEVALGLALASPCNTSLEIREEDLQIVERLTRHSAPRVRMQAFYCAGRAGKNNPSLAKRAAEIISETHLADAHLGWQFGNAIGEYGMPVTAFTKSQMERVLANLVAVDRLNGNGVHLQALLKEVAGVWPDLVAELLIERLKHSRQADPSYSCWGGLDLADLLAGLVESPLLRDLLRSVRDAAEMEGVSDDHGRDLFWALARSDMQADEVLSEWLSDPEPKRRDVADYWATSRGYRSPYTMLQINPQTTSEAVQNSV